MGQGRPPKSTKLKQIQGTLRAHRQTPDEAIPEALETIPPVPILLQNTKYGSDIWTETMNHYFSMGMVYAIDLPFILLLCNNLTRSIELGEWLQENGYTFTTPNGFEQKRPEANLAKEAEEAALKMACQFGLTQSARTKLSMPGKEKENDLDKILNR